MAEVFDNGVGFSEDMMLNIISRLDCKHCVPLTAISKNWYNSLGNEEFRDRQHNKIHLFDCNTYSMFEVTLPKKSGLTLLVH